MTVRTGPLNSNQERFDSAENKEGQRGNEIENTDALMIDSRKPRPGGSEFARPD
jgi:hypothetical protein